MSYTAGAKIAWIKDDTIRLEKEILNINLKMTPDEYIRTCKDTKGKTLLDKYTIVH